MSSGLTLDQLYALFTPSPCPSSFGSFEIFGSEAVILPIGQEKPESAGDLPPYRQRTAGRGTRRFQMARPKPKKENPADKPTRKVVSTVVEVNPRFEGMEFSSWAKPKKGAEGAKPLNPAPETKQPTATWAKPAKPQAHPFAELMAEEENNVSMNPGLAWGAPATTSSKPDDSEWPSLSGPTRTDTKKKSAWGNIKP